MHCAAGIKLTWMSAMRGIRSAPLGLGAVIFTEPRAMPWACEGLARWAEMQQDRFGASSVKRENDMERTLRPFCQEAA